MDGLASASEGLDHPSHPGRERESDGMPGAPS